MTKISEALTYGLTVRESATDGSDFTNPATDYRRLFLGEDGQLHVKDSAGTVTAIGSGAITTKDEGSTLYAAVTTLDFVGAGVVASGAGATTTVTIAGGGGGGTPAEAAASLIAAYSLFR